MRFFLTAIPAAPQAPPASRPRQKHIKPSHTQIDLAALISKILHSYLAYEARAYVVELSRVRVRSSTQGFTEISIYGIIYRVDFWIPRRVNF